MNNILILTSTQYGQTAKIAAFIRDNLTQEGWNVVSSDVAYAGKLPLELFDSVILGSPVYAGKFSSHLIEWARKNARVLKDKRLGFYSVSLNAADKRPQARIDDARLLQQFVQQSEIAPLFLASFAGTIHYTKYGFLKRWMMKKISASAGGPTDTSRDHEMTDWNKVEEFVRAFRLQAAPSSFFIIGGHSFEQPDQTPPDRELTDRKAS